MFIALHVMYNHFCTKKSKIEDKNQLDNHAVSTTSSRCRGILSGWLAQPKTNHILMPVYCANQAFLLCGRKQTDNPPFGTVVLYLNSVFFVRCTSSYHSTRRTDHSIKENLEPEELDNQTFSEISVWATRAAFGRPSFLKGSKVCFS